MKRILFVAAAACLILPSCSQKTLNEGNIDKIIKAMTLEEKATLCVGGGDLPLEYNDPTGQSLGPVEGAAGKTRSIERLGIPVTYLADGPAGLRIALKRTVPNSNQTKSFYCTGFPTATMLASSWDLELVEKVTTAMGNEVLEFGADALLAPALNLHRNPLNGRNFEYFSEDPVLSGNMAAAYIKGIQSNNVGSTVKHFAVNSQESNRMENDAQVSTRALRELYLKNFEIAITKGQPWAVMSSYNKIDGEYAQQSEDLLTKVLRNDWGYEGFVMTDWGMKEGTVKAAAAGNDLMEPGNPKEIERLVEAVKSGALSEEVLDRNVRNILGFIVKTPSFRNYKHNNRPDIKAHALVAREAAAEAVVMLKNDNGALPFKGVKNVALYGSGATNFVAGGTGSGDVNKPYTRNMRQGLEAAGYTVDESILALYRGVSGEADIPAATIAKNAASNDAAVIVIRRNAGEGADRKVEGDFELTATEKNTIKNVSAAFQRLGKKVVVVLNVGGVVETSSWKNLPDAILLPWSPGEEGAIALGEIISGKVNPSGKLPATFPVSYFDHPSSANFPYDYVRAPRGSQPAPDAGNRKNVDYTSYEEGIWVGYRYFDTAGKEVSYPFGYGLSYTTFSYSNADVKATDDGFTATVSVTNTGSVAGKEVVELYVAAPAGNLQKPAKELKSFAKTKLLAPGESQTLSFNVSAYELASFNQGANRWEAASGTYSVLFGQNIESILAQGSFSLGQEKTWEVSDAFKNYEVKELAVK